MSKEYVVQQEGAYRITGTRVSLDSAVYAFRRGASPESIQRSFPTLTLEQIYGAITFYLAHQEEIDQYLLDGEAEHEKLRAASRAAHPEFYEKLDRARKEALTSRS
ncbi:MAG: hypothetical protein QOJ02_2861 [Acidobacteriota bacterium]|jgi:uncharacterized protein (DUF433 family)|nr:hypothetical protein [Acidobacteriota bacterium]